MKRNVAGQVVGAQLIAAADGTAFTGAVTVAVTVDGGTQATGSVGAGACAHEGNGYHTYTPAQAETDGELVAFTFTGTGAVPVTVQVYPSFPQSGDGPTVVAIADEVETRTLAAVTTVVDKTGFSLADAPGWKKNTARPDFPFPMELTDGTPAAGVTVTCKRSLQGGALANCANTPATEVGGGVYKITLAAADTNADDIYFEFTATGCTPLKFTVSTES